MTESPQSENDLLKTPLDSLHREHGAKMVPFAGYEMPVQYEPGILKEHLHTREHASLFDVSHMGQAVLKGSRAAERLEALVPGDIQGLAAGQMRYTVLTNDEGGILDDLMVTNMGDHLFLVVNAACKEQDFAHIAGNIGDDVELERIEDRALIALQGPAAADVFSRFVKPAPHMLFMTAEELHFNDIPCLVTRSGYTGEDGYEISVPDGAVEDVVRLVLGESEVRFAGLGARDSLRLEAGLCLYGSDIDETTTPVEAGLTWIIGERRRAEGGFPGAEKILAQIADGAPRKRVGLKPEGKAPARAHTEIVDTAGNAIGEITSGGFGPSVDGPVAMGYVTAQFAKPDTEVNLVVRGKPRPARTVKMPFTPHRYATSTLYHN